MLSSNDLARFRARLESERADLSAQLADYQQQIATTADDSEIGSHYGDSATNLFDREQALELIERTRDSLRAVDHALERISTGTYGVSEVSGKPIPIERLEALPTATTLVDESAPKL